MGSVMNKYAPTPTDYSTIDNWLAFFDRGCEVDAFYLYPTMGHDNPRDPFCESSDRTMRAIALDVAPTQILPWIWECNIYAPFYRQAGFSAMKPILESTTANRMEAAAHVENFLREEAMEDIYAALDYFFEHQNKGKPFFIVSHSQGSILMKIALEDYRGKHPERFERMIAAYCPGWMFTQEWCERVSLPFSQSPTDTGVLVSWNAEWPSAPDDFNTCAAPGALCMNPITWNDSTTPSHPGKSLGTLVLNPEAMEALERELILAFSVEMGFLEAKEEVEDERLQSILQNEEFLIASYEVMGSMWEEVVWAGPSSINKLGEIAAAGSSGGKIDAIPFTVKPGYVTAWVNPERGTLSVEYPEEKNLTPKALGKKSLHMLELPLFFEDIHKNVCDRIAAWKARG